MLRGIKICISEQLQTVYLFQVMFRGGVFVLEVLSVLLGYVSLEPAEIATF